MAVAPAMASQEIAVPAGQPTLIVNKYGIARVSYTNAHGVRVHVLAWGAINARTPSQSVAQVKFKLDYSGGYGSFGANYWRRMHNYCGKYTGPPLHHLLFACTARDGTYWALQTWRRGLRDGGWPTTGVRRDKELHLSHWSGSLPVLFADTSWLSGGKYDEVFGYLHYASTGVYGFSSTSKGSPTDTYGRNVYLDTHNPAWGRGWFRFNSALTHRSNGNFCIGMYRLYGRTHTAKGDEYRLTVMGPGVTPILQWKRPAPGRFSTSVFQQRYNELISFTPAGDPCRKT
ncbi:MAG: hypothetical protein ACTHNU_06545 [Gaiellales bacterium]